MNTYILAFFFFGLLGWIWESVYCTICDRKWANRGFLYGPICPIYGFGGIIGLAAYNLIGKGLLPDLSWWEILIVGFAVSMILEYPTSWLLEKLFHARWWDYSEVPLNINGRTSVPTSVAFGAAAILVVKILSPFTIQLFSAVPDWCSDLFSLILVAIMSADITLTVSALTDFQKHISEVDEAFQDHMTSAVYRVIKSQNRIYSKAIDRISSFKLPAKKALIAKRIREQKFEELIKEYMESPAIRKMDDFMQHGSTTTLEHCKNVAWVSFVINDRLHLNADEKDLIECAMLHDFYLYDWHDGKPERKTHGFDHPYIASENAAKSFEISEKTESAIKSHMWPLNITEIPKSKEARLLCFVDKYCAVIETLRIGKMR